MRAVRVRTDVVCLAASWCLVALVAFLFVTPEAGSPTAGPSLALLAASLPLAGLLARHLELARKLDRIDRSLAENLTELEMVEGLAGIGRWSIDISTGHHRWSEEMCHIVGAASNPEPDAEYFDRVMPEGLKQLETTLQAHRNDRDTYIVEFEIDREDGEARILRASARNDFDEDGTLHQIFMVVRDVTDEYRKVADMEREWGMALRQAEEARRLANTDALTGLANRRYMMGEIDKAIMAARRDGTPLALIVFDIDHFKKVNDTFGHTTGDAVLVKVAELARAQARNGDCVGRIGGEEFLWLLPGSDERTACEVAERLRWAIEAGSASAPIPPVTISAGHASLEPGDASLILFARADAALYEAKRAGRNQVRKAA